MYGLSPVCDRMCFVTSFLVANALEHIEHLCGLVPECIRCQCLLQVEFNLNFMSHMSHL